MSLQGFTRRSRCTPNRQALSPRDGGCSEHHWLGGPLCRTCLSILVLASIFLASAASAEWKLDLSRRKKSVRDADLLEAGSREQISNDFSQQEESSGQGFWGRLLDAGEPAQEIVIMQTEKGFVPSVVRLRQGGRYTVHVVNVNEREKNVSFILDGFSEHHATYYGRVKKFQLEPKKEGIFSFQSPETSAHGQLIVFSSGSASQRRPAHQEAPK